VTTRYTYNAAGQRVRKVSSTGPQSTVVFVYDQAGHLLGEYDQNGAPMREYVWLRDTPMAMFTPDPANPSGEPLVYFIHTDHLNTPRVVVDRQNRVRWRWLAEPFGTSAPETDPSGLGGFTQNLRFPGQYADAESGLFYNYFRNYDSSKGGYTQSDPIGLAGGVNTYGYVEANPLSWIDPMGLDRWGGEGKGPVSEPKCLPPEASAGVPDAGKGKYEKPSNPNKKPPPPHRVQSNERERNIGHKDAEEHGRRSKGQRGIRGGRGGLGILLYLDLFEAMCEENPMLGECQLMFQPPPCDCELKA
jgi:RHS repeat-associated protein